MPYDISQFSPAYGGTINSAGNVVNVADLIDETTGLMKPGSMKAMTFQTGATAIGNGTANDITGYATLALRVVISGTASVTFEASIDGTNFTALYGLRTDSVYTASVTATNDIRFNVVGYKSFRARISAYTSGTVDVTGYASTAASSLPSAVSTTFGNSDTNSATHVIQGVGAYNLLFDGTNWVRQRTVLSAGDATNSLSANGIYGFNGSTWDKLRSVNTGQLKATLYNSVGAEPIISASLASNDGVGTGSNLLGVANYNLGYNGATYDRVRVGKVYKYIEYLNLANATATTVWTPAAGKKFRLMHITIQSTIANNVHIKDGAGGTIFSTLRFTTSELHVDVTFGNGYLSSAANNVLEIYNATGSTGSFWVTAWGTEE